LPVAVITDSLPYWCDNVTISEINVHDLASCHKPTFNQYTNIWHITEPSNVLTKKISLNVKCFAFSFCTLCGVDFTLSQFNIMQLTQKFFSIQLTSLMSQLSKIN